MLNSFFSLFFNPQSFVLENDFTELFKHLQIEFKGYFNKVYFGMFLLF